MSGGGTLLGLLFGLEQKKIKVHNKYLFLNKKLQNNLLKSTINKN